MARIAMPPWVRRYVYVQKKKSVKKKIIVKKVKKPVDDLQLYMS